MLLKRAQHFATCSLLLVFPMDAESNVEVHLPVPRKLAQKWEGNALIRGSLREGKRLLQWPQPQQTCVATVAAVKLNRQVVVELMELWAGCCPIPKSPPVDWIRNEAGCCE